MEEEEAEESIQKESREVRRRMEGTLRRGKHLRKSERRDIPPGLPFFFLEKPWLERGGKEAGVIGESCDRFTVGPRERGNY